MISKLEDIFEVGTEGYSEVLDFTTNIPLVSWMLNPKRTKVKDLPKDKDGKVIVDITRPHILEDMSYFTKAAQTFKTTGKYCPYYPSRSPNSPYKQFWDEEKRRCLEGYVREDGEWITGYHYYYLNYSPIMIVRRVNETGKRSVKFSDFPDVWDGDYMFFHYVEQAEERGLHGAIIKARRKGYSFKLASMLQRNYFLVKESKSYAFASNSEYLDTDGILSKADDNFSFVNTHCGFSKKLALKDTIMHRISGYKKSGDSTEYGFKSERIGVTTKNDPNKVRGKSGKLVAYEEAGSNPNLVQSWSISLDSVRQGELVFGFMVAFGTGGDKSSNFQGLESLFYEGEGYEIYVIRNVFDKNSDRNYCGLFVPDYLNRSNCYDNNGNSDVVKAMGEVIDMRKKIQKSSSDAQYLTRRRAEVPFTPQEAVMRIQGSEFPIAELKDYLAEISPSKEVFLGKHYIVELKWLTTDLVDYSLALDKKPIRDYPFNGNDITGAIELFELPIIEKGEVKPTWGRYVIGNDPVDDDTNKTHRISLMSTWVFDLWKDVIVAEWTGRHPNADDNFEVVLKLAVLYNAQINYENKQKGLYDFFNRKNKLKYLMSTPSILKDMDYIKDKNLIGNRSFGTPPNITINSWARKKIADWMRTENINRPYIVQRPDGEDIEQYPLGLRTIRSIGLLKEAISWNLDGNFDRVSGLGMVFIARADLAKRVESTRNQSNSEEVAYADDDFIKNNYTNKVRLSRTFDF